METEIVTALIGGVGIIILSCQLAATELNIIAVKLWAVFAFGVNFLTVQIPGRLDGEVAEAMRNADIAAIDGTEARNALLPALGKSYITPAGWAFAIWGPIYVGEIVFTFLTAFLKVSTPAEKAVKAFLPYWVSANLFQSMWCYAFRPIFHTDSAREALGPFLSALFLGLTALSLGKVHMVVSRVGPSCTLKRQAMFVPLTMHFGWTTAATLVNINGALANYKDAGSDTNLYRLGVASVAAALIACVYISIKTRSPTYSFVIGWALLAVSDGMNARIRNAKNVAVAASAKHILSVSNLAGLTSILVGIVLVLWLPANTSSRTVPKEKRLAEDGEAYTYEEFISYFGEADGKAYWEAAQTFTSDHLQPTSDAGSARKPPTSSFLIEGSRP